MTIRRSGLIVACGLAAAVTAGQPVHGVDDRSTSGGSAAPRSAEEEVAAAQAILDAAMAEPSSWEFPTEPVTNSLEGVTVGIVTCGPQYNCERHADGVVAAVTALGGTPRLFTPTRQTADEVNGAFLNLIQEGAGAIVDIAWPRAILGPTLAEVEARGIPFISIRAEPSDDTDPTDIKYPGGDESAEGFGGRLAAAYFIANSNAQAQVIVLGDPEIPPVTAAVAAFKETLAGCSRCQIVEERDFPAAVWTTDIAPAVVSMLQRNPDVEFVFANIDQMNEFACAGIDQAGRGGQVFAGGGTGGEPATLEVIEEGGCVPFTAASPLEWIGWSAVDQLLRLMADQPLVEHPMPYRLLTAENITDPGEPWRSEIDYEAAFEALWGIS